MDHECRFMGERSLATTSHLGPRARTAACRFFCPVSRPRPPATSPAPCTGGPHPPTPGRASREKADRPLSAAPGLPSAVLPFANFRVPPRGSFRVGGISRRLPAPAPPPPEIPRFPNLFLPRENFRTPSCHDFLGVFTVLTSKARRSALAGRPCASDFGLGNPAQHCYQVPEWSVFQSGERPDRKSGRSVGEQTGARRRVNRARSAPPRGRRHVHKTFH